MREIATSIDIAAPAARVWAVLTAFETYPRWNPFITRIEGKAAEGTRLKLQIAAPGKSGMTFKPTVIAVAPGRHLCWLGHLLVPGLADGRHDLRIEDHGAGVRFHQSERFRGILVPIFGARVLDATRRGFEQMNAALKKEAESSIIYTLPDTAPNSGTIANAVPLSPS